MRADAPSRPWTPSTTRSSARSRATSSSSGAARDLVGDVLQHPIPAAPGPPVVPLVLQAASVGAVEDAQVAIASLPEVAEVEVLFPKSFRVYGAWVDERVERAARPKR
jgi:hypothetical protein